jgi:hypothetical protein
MGFGVIIGFIDHLQIVTTSHYSAIANSDTLCHPATLFLGDINMGPRPPGWGSLEIETVKCGHEWT